MCFSITLSVAKQSGQRAQDKLSTLGPLYVDGTPGTDDRFYAWITEDQSCGCSLLAGGTDMQGDCWLLAPGIPEKLASTVRAVAQAFATDFELIAVFSEAIPERDERVDLSAMLALIEANRIQDRTTYRVSV